MTISFTYLIYCHPTKQVYYGVRWAKNCSPKDLWTTYFTSSEYVKSLVKKYGKDSFSCEVRKTFNTPNEAKLWEQKVLQRINASNRKDFINKSMKMVDYQERTWIKRDTESKFVDSLLLDTYLEQGWTLGRYFSNEHRQKNSYSVKKYFEKNDANFKGKTHTKEARQSMSKKRKNKNLYESNPNAKSFLLDGKTYPCLRTAMEATGMSYYICRKHGSFVNLE